MSKLKLKMNQRYPQAHDSGSTEFDSHQADKHFDFSDEFEGVNDEKDDDAEDGIEPQLIFTTPDVRNIGSFTPTPRPKPTKKPKNAITPVGVSHAYRPANYSYRRNNNHRKSTHPYSSVETTESYDNLYDHRLQATLPQPPAYDREEDNDEYGNSKEGLGNYHSGHNHKDTPLNGDPFPSYPRHKGYETPPNYFSTPSGPPSSKPKVKQKPNPPPDQADDEEEYYEEDNAQDDNYDQRKQNVDDNDNDNENEGDDEYYGEGYDDEEYAEDYKHERPTQLNGTRARPPRPPKMMQNAKQRGKQPLISSNNSKSGDDDEYYYDDYYDDDEYYDDVTTNKVTQPSTRHKSNVTMDPAISSSIDAYTVLKTSPAYRKSKTFPAANRTEPEHTSPLADVTSTSRPNQVSTTPRYFIKPKMRKKTTPHQSEIPAPKSNLTTPSTPTLHYPRKFNRLKNKLNATLPMTPKVRTENVTQTNNVTMPPKHRKNRPKYKNYPMRNRTTPIVQNTTPESPLEGAQSNRPPLKDASLEGAQSNRNQQKDTSLEGAQSNRNQLKATSLEGAQSNRNQLKDTSLEGAQSNRTPLTQTEAPENHKFGGKARHKNHRAQTTEATRPPPPSLPTQKIQKSTPHTFSSPAKHQEADTDEYIPANHKPQPAGRPLTNTRGSASHKPNQKQPQKFTYSPPSGEATDRVSVAPPNYVQQQQAPVHVASAGVANRGIYNGTQYNPSQQQFDSYYNLYNDESELYGDDDYGQYHVSSRGKPQIEIVQRLPEKNAVAYTPVQSYKQQENAYTPSYKTQGNVAYTPSYKQQSSDIYNVDDYNQQYNLQGADDDLSYQPGIIANKPSIRGRHRGSATYTTVSSDSDRGSLSGGRPTLKPSTSIVSKTSDYYDIYRFPPRRPEAVYPTPQVDKTAAKCRKDVCLLPDCYCGGKDIPGDLTPEETPQIVLLTFDDSVNDLNKGLYSDLFEKGRTNPNGCPISATFYVSHEWTDYSQVQNLYATGHEIASHSVSHSFGEQFSQKKWTREIAGQREILAAYGGVKLEDIRGMRAPFLAVGGNKMFKMLYDSNFTYDSSMPVYENRPPSWPYTFDYKIFHDCMIPPCPTRSYPGVWEVPMVMWQDLNGGRCSMGDACSNPPTADGVYKMLVKNFERHFTTNRAPLGLFYHAAWFTQPHHKEGFIAFLDTIVNMPEVWVVTNWQALQWVRDPTPISRLRNFTPFGCDYPDRPRKCNNPKVCNLWHKSGVRYMRTCQPCPDIYPWTGKTGIKNSKVDNEIIQE
ncbi:unnamed protein product [Bemisia tabaci]|uniref:NodB homology domain-containing protein n=1 Tax=Bemisia tabaci TaxID=7038 RepID=A0A9P0AD99_BEMTA|nr:unnamed protein product [Bemisia tabaci]